MIDKEKGKFVLPDVSHIGVVTNNLDKTMKEMEDLYGLKPFMVMEPGYVNTYLRGKPAEFKLKSAFYRSGQVVFEVISVLEGDTIYDEWLKEKGEGIHHLGYDIDNIEEWIDYYKGKGIGVLQSGERPGVKWAYLDTAVYTGMIMELIERTEEGKFIK
ncbi:MAG: VOC family protein [Thermodesulfobacteriota bacterium]